MRHAVFRVLKLIVVYGKKGTLASFDIEKEKKNSDRWDLKWQRAPKWAVPRPVRYIARISPQTHQLDPYLMDISVN